MVGIELELAINLICDSVESISDIEEVNIEEARNRIIGEDIIAPINQPPFDRSPLDGYALRAEDIIGASKENPVKLAVSLDSLKENITTITMGRYIMSSRTAR